MSWQAFPSLPQMSHWYLNVIGCAPFQVPGVAVSVPPALASPVIDGGGATDRRQRAVRRCDRRPGHHGSRGTDDDERRDTDNEQHAASWPLHSNPFLPLRLPATSTVSLAEKSAITASASEVLTKS